MANGTVKTDIDFQAADTWRKEVENELAEVDRLLQEVATACTEMPGEKDPLINMIEQTGNGLSAAWKTLTTGFTAACESIKKGIDELARGGQAALDKLKKYADTIGQ